MFEDSSPIFADTEDPFTIRFHVKARTVLDFEKAIPIERPKLWERLSFTRDIEVGSFGWAQQARLRQSLVQIGEEDGHIISDAIARQERDQHAFPLDPADRRHIDIANRTVSAPSRVKGRSRFRNMTRPSQRAMTRLQKFVAR